MLSSRRTAPCYYFANYAVIVSFDGLKEKLKKGTPLNIKLGPTSPDLHLGHVFLCKMSVPRPGHNVTLIIGSGTALIGDPSVEILPVLRPPQSSRCQRRDLALTRLSEDFRPERTTAVYNGD